MYTVMLWKPKHELRVINTAGDWRSPTYANEFAFLPEHAESPPRFATADEGWAYVRTQYPQLQP